MVIDRDQRAVKMDFSITVYLLVSLAQRFNMKLTERQLRQLMTFKAREVLYSERNNMHFYFELLIQIFVGIHGHLQQLLQTVWLKHVIGYSAPRF